MDMHSSLQLVAVEEPVTMATPVMPVTMATPVMPVSGGETERRFGKLVSDQELQRLMDDRVPPETRRKIKWAAQLFEKWAILLGMSSAIHFGEFPEDIRKYFSLRSSLDLEFLLA